MDNIASLGAFCIKHLRTPMSCVRRVRTLLAAYFMHPNHHEKHNLLFVKIGSVILNSKRRSSPALPGHAYNVELLLMSPEQCSKSMCPVWHGRPSR